MRDVCRMIDMNLNRAAEGLRILEDCCRFDPSRQALGAAFKTLRRTLRQLGAPLERQLLESRTPGLDQGPRLSALTGGQGPASDRRLETVNARRVQEALRALEECLKLLPDGSLAQRCEALRFQMYALEQRLSPAGPDERRRVLGEADLYGITAAEWSRGRGNEATVRAMLAGGVRLIQYREKDLPLREQYRECLAIRDLTAAAGALMIVNDHAELALAVEADGVHIGQDDLPPAAVRRVIGPDRLLGISTHSPAQARAALAAGADYLGVGPLFSTRTKRDVCAPVGLDYLAYAAEQVPIPFVAIGGIKRHNLPAVVARGARLVCLVTEIVGAEDPAARIAEIRSIIQEAKDDGTVHDTAAGGPAGNRDAPDAGSGQT